MTATPAPPTYSSADVCDRAGISYWQLDNYVRQGYLRPQWRSRTGVPLCWGGSGIDRIFTQGELDRARMIARLVALGIHAQQAAKVARDPDTLERWIAAVVGVVFSNP